MSDPQQPTFLVNAYADPVVVRINGKANYLNCNAFREFIEKVIADGCKHLFVDFSNCRGMDSTFLGILAGAAIQLRKLKPEGELAIGNLNERNRELISNLGLENLLRLRESSPVNPEGLRALENQEVSEAKNILKAHEDLTHADAENLAKFQDVIAFLKNQVEDKGPK